MRDMAPSPWLYAFLKAQEQFRPTAFRPTKRDVWTIGYGHTKGVKEGDTCTTAQAEEWLQQDVVTAVMAVRNLVKVALTQNQFDALVSLIYNCGPEPLEKTLGQQLNAGNYNGAAGQFKRWDYQAGKELPGLETRRVAEMNHFLLAA